MAKKKRPRRRPEPPRLAARAPSPSRDADETRLLQLARELSTLGRLEPAEAVRGALTRLAPAPPAARARDKGRVLALAWAREQARLALADVLERGAKAGVVRRDVPAATLAWLVLAACDTLRREPVDAAADRLHALAAFIGVPAD